VQAIQDSSLAFNLLFTVEMAIKWCALGLFGPASYFADRWNWLDSFIVFMGYITYIPGVGDISALRTLRVLRPLRTLNSVPGMRMIVGSMLKALPALGNVGLLALFTLLVFGIIGVQLWSGLMRGACAYTDPDSLAVAFIPNSGMGVWCALPCSAQEGTDCTPTYGDGCAAYPLLRTAADNTTYVSVVDAFCAATPLSAAFGTNGFDNIGQALATSYVMITLEGWSTIMYQLQHAWGLSVVVAIYSIMLTAFGAFFLLQLALAVIMENYERSEADEVANCDKIIADNSDLLPLRPRQEGMLAKKSWSKRLQALRASSPLASGSGSTKVESGSLADIAGASSAPGATEYALTLFSSAFKGGRAKVGVAAEVEMVPLANSDAAAAAVSEVRTIPPVPAGGQRQSSTIVIALDGSVAGALGPATPRKLQPLSGVDVTEDLASPGKFFVRPVAVTEDLPGAVTSSAVVVADAALPSAGAVDWPVAKPAPLHISRSVSSIVSPDPAPSPTGDGGSLTPGSRDSPGGSTGRRAKPPLTGYWELDLAGVNEYVPPPAPPPPPYWPALHAAMHSPYVSSFTMAVIIANFMQLACPYYGMSDAYIAGLDYANYVFSAIFGLELIGKIMGSGPGLYFSDSFNCFDCFVVVLSFLDIGLSQAGLSAGGLSALRTFRLARVMKLARGWPELRIMIGTLVRAFGQVTNALIVMALVMLIFTLFGMQLLGGMYHPLIASGVMSEVPRPNYDTFFWGFITTFQICTLENWNSELADGYAAIGITGSIFFVVLVMVGSYMFLNLFLAILLDSFEDGMAEQAAEMEELRAERHRVKEVAKALAKAEKLRLREEAEAIALGDEGPAIIAARHAALAAAAAQKAETPTEVKEEVQAKLTFNKGGTVSQFKSTMMSASGRKVHVRVLPSGDVRVIADEADSVATQDTQSSRTLSSQGDDDEDDGATKRRSIFDCLPLATNASMGLFSPSSAFRRIAMALTRDKRFEQFILLLILISSINLALDEPRIAACSVLPASDPGNCIALSAWLTWSDIIITGFFVLEMTAKIVAIGFVRTPHAYIGNNWNKLDFFIVLISVLSLALAEQAAQLKALRSLRALRALRPLRVVSRYPGLKLVVNSVFGALPKMKTVFVLNIGFILIMAIVGLQNFSGVLSNCNDPSTPDKVDCVGTYSITGDDCLVLPTMAAEIACRNTNGTDWERRWEPAAANFENVWSGLLTTFELASGENWPGLMVGSAVDAVGYDLPMQRDANQPAGLFAVVIQFMCGMFLLDLFTGVVIAKYQELKEQSQGNGLLTPEQQLWVEQTKMMMSSAPSKQMLRPKSKYPRVRYFRNRAYDLAVSKPFEIFIMGVILANTAALASKYYGWTPRDQEITEGLNDAFALIFAVEAAIKLTAFGVKQYFGTNWSRFDFLIVIASLIGKLFTLGPIATLLRVVRVARIFRLVRSSRGLLLLFRTLVVSLPSLANVGIVLVLLFFIFSILGMNLFAGVRYGRTGMLNGDANFDSFWISMQTLYRCSTGENYNGLMHDQMVAPPYCVEEGPEANCGSNIVPPIYWPLFYVLANFIMIQLLVAVVLDNFAEAMAADLADEEFKLTPELVEKYAEAWALSDPSASMHVDSNGLQRVILRLPFPLGLLDAPGVVHEQSLRKSAQRLMVEMAIMPVEGGQFQYHTVLQALVQRATDRNSAMGGKTIAAKTTIDGGVKGADFTIQEHLAALLLQGMYRARRGRRQAAQRRATMLQDGRITQLSHEERLAEARQYQASLAGGDKLPAGRRQSLSWGGLSRKASSRRVVAETLATSRGSTGGSLSSLLSSSPLYSRRDLVSPTSAASTTTGASKADAAPAAVEPAAVVEAPAPITAAPTEEAPHAVEPAAESTATVAVALAPAAPSAGATPFASPTPVLATWSLQHVPSSQETALPGQPATRDSEEDL